MILCGHFEGSPDRKSRVESFWIDYSDDCCQWQSHPQGEIKCKYLDHSRRSKKVSLGRANLAPISESASDDGSGVFAEIMIWPTITARFIRIRPYTILNKVAVRMELFGYRDIVRSANEYARVVTLNDVNERDKGALMERTKNLPANTRVIQVDCKAVIQAALDKAKITSVGFETHRISLSLCISMFESVETNRNLAESVECGVTRYF